MTNTTCALLTSALLSLVPAIAAADPEPGVVEGLVVAGDDYAPAASASIVMIEESERVFSSALTNQAGRFRFTHVPPGTYEVLAIWGTSQGTRTIRVAEGARQTVGITLAGDRPVEQITIRERVTPAMSPVPPLPIRASVPRRLAYSDEAIDENAWGLAWLLLYVDEHGRVDAVKYLRRPGHGLDDIALGHIWKLELQPARDESGQPVKAVVLWKVEWPAYWWNVDYEHIAYSRAVPKIPGRLGITPLGLPQSNFGSFMSPTSTVPVVPTCGAPLNLDLTLAAGRDCARPDFALAPSLPLIARPIK